MDFLSFVIQVLAATTLLLYSIRMIQTGISRAYGGNFKNRMAKVKSVPRSIFTGLMMAVIMQSSIAVTMLTTVFSRNRALSFGVGISIVIGADIGSSLIIQVLTLNLNWLLPLLLFSGGALFLRTEKPKTKQIGRILLGVALVLVSLRFLREAVAPIAANDALPLISIFLEQDQITAFLIGAGLAFIMHSSLAAILMILTLVSTSIISLESGISLVMGANFGSALVPIWLSRNMNDIVREIPWGNFVFRGIGAAIFMVMLHNSLFVRQLNGYSSEQVLVFIHIAFNTSLILLLPLRSFVQRLLHIFIKQDEPSAKQISSDHKSLLDYSMVSSPDLAISNLKREILRMSYLVNSMIEPLIIISKKPDREGMKLLSNQNSHLSTAFDLVRDYVSSISDSKLNKSDRKQLRDLISYSTQLKRTGEIIVNNLLPRFKDGAKSGVALSNDGEAELTEIHTKLNTNFSIATNLILTNELNTAKMVIENKNSISILLRTSQKKHFERIRAGLLQSVESSNLHLEILHSFRDINGRLASIAYPELAEADLLSESRLLEE